MKTVAVVINVGTLNFSEIALRAVKKYYDNIGIEVRVITEMPEFMTVKKPKWTMSLVFDIYNDIDFAIVQDADILPCNLKHNILDFILPEYINMCVDTTRLGEKISNAPFPFFRYNAGLIGYGKQYKDMFREIYEYGKDDPQKFGTCDQYYINQHIGKNEIFINELPIIFNRFFSYNIDYSKTAFCHYTNSIATEEKLDTILKYHPGEMINGNV